MHIVSSKFGSNSSFSDSRAWTASQFIQLQIAAACHLPQRKRRGAPIRPRGGCGKVAAIFRAQFWGHLSTGCRNTVTGPKTTSEKRPPACSVIWLHRACEIGAEVLLFPPLPVLISDSKHLSRGDKTLRKRRVAQPAGGNGKHRARRRFAGGVWLSLREACCTNTAVQKRCQ